MTRGAQTSPGRTDEAAEEAWRRRGPLGPSVAERARRQTAECLTWAYELPKTGDS
jgi:hypothetical protein